MVTACSMHVIDEKWVHNFGLKTWMEKKNHLGRPRLMWEDDFEETRKHYIDWSYQAQDTVMNLRVPRNTGSFLPSWATLVVSQGLRFNQNRNLTMDNVKLHVYIYVCNIFGVENSEIEVRLNNSYYMRFYVQNIGIYLPSHTGSQPRRHNLNSYDWRK
jgi:hypothetical protein